MEKEVYNKSLSARIRRRNKQGFNGNGTGLGFIIENPGDYRDEKQNHKDKDYKLDKARKAKLGYNSSNYKFDDNGNLMHVFKRRNRQMCKKYADNHQKLN